MRVGKKNAPAASLYLLSFAEACGNVHSAKVSAPVELEEGWLVEAGYDVLMIVEGVEFDGVVTGNLMRKTPAANLPVSLVRRCGGGNRGAVCTVHSDRGARGMH